jgi:BMFP domain-containing protein YqiC
MQSQNSIFDDVARLMTGAMGMAQGVQDEARTFMRTQADRLVADMDLVSREEFEALRETALEAKAQADTLRQQVAALESRLEALLAKG